jgi:hypothetical protein
VELESWGKPDLHLAISKAKTMSQSKPLGLEITNFHPNAILRGAQLTIVGALRALQNPGIFTSSHYRQAAIAVAAGIAIRLAIAIPV